MKKLLLVSIFFLNSTINFACPFCGCGNSNFQIGILPTYSKLLVGLRYNYLQFNSLSNDGSQFSKDYFHATELMAGYQKGKFQTMVFLPYVATHKQSDDGVVDTKGIGDMIILGNYKAYSTSYTNSKTNRTYQHNLWLGAGIKFSTGESRVDIDDPSFSVGDFSSQPGTGSIDYLANLTYNLLWGNNGVVTNGTFRYNTANSQQFHYGNKFYFNTAYFHSWPVGLTIIRPSIGLNLLTNGLNKFQDQEVSESNGYILSSVIGANLQRGKLGFSLNGFIPIEQDLFRGQTQIQSRVSFGFTFSL